ncbi:MAG: hypothetical protein R3Y26_04205 [Rikenellaceae bacterium]
MIDIYQSVKSNPPRNTPWWCKDEKAWLGCGYYFWEHYIDNAHWWGHLWYTRKGLDYKIYKSSYTKNEFTCFDLIDNYKHKDTLKDVIELTKKRNLYDAKTTTIGRIIAFMIEIGIFDFKATRMQHPSRSLNNKFSDSINIDNKQRFDLTPQIQVCFYDMSLITDGGYSLIYPEQYPEGYNI